MPGLIVHTGRGDVRKLVRGESFDANIYRNPCEDECLVIVNKKDFPFVEFRNAQSITVYMGKDRESAEIQKKCLESQKE